MNDDYVRRVEEGAIFLRERLSLRPEVVVIQGTGQDVLPDGFITDGSIDYADIPNFPESSAPGHPGRLVCGQLAGRGCLLLQGRVHCYEGFDARQITLPLRVAVALGVKVLLITNTAGGLNLDFSAGDLMVISDHLNFIGHNPLRGANHDEWGPRFPDMSQAYSRRLRAIAEQAAARLGIRLKQGVYVAIPGPSLETPAETRYLRNCGADAVGMSTVLEVIVAVHAGLEVFGLSVIANVNDPERMQPVILHEVIRQVKMTEENSRRLLGEIIRSLS